MRTNRHSISLGLLALLIVLFLGLPLGIVSHNPGTIGMAGVVAVFVGLIVAASHAQWHL